MSNKKKRISKDEAFETFEQTIYEEMANLPNLLNRCSDKEKLQMLLKLMPFVRGKMSTVDMLDSDFNFKMLD